MMEPLIRTRKYSIQIVLVACLLLLPLSFRPAKAETSDDDNQLLFADAALCGEAGFGTAAAGGDCGNQGTAELYFDGDHSESAITVCISSGDGTTEGTLQDATISTDRNHTTVCSGSCQYAYDGTGSANDYFSMPVTAAEFSSDEGYIDFYIYFEALTGNNSIFEAVESDGTNEMGAYVATNGTVLFWHTGNGDGENVTTTATITATQWDHVEIRWKVSTGDMWVNINSGGWEGSDSKTMTSMTAEPTDFKLGELNNAATVSDVYQIDDFFLWNTYDKR